jgi:hypothetical protein
MTIHHQPRQKEEEEEEEDPFKEEDLFKEKALLGWEQAKIAGWRREVCRLGCL